MGFHQRADLVGGPVDLLAERHLPALQDCGEPMGQRFDFYLEPGPAQLPEQNLEALADDAVGQDVIFRDRQLCVLLRQPEKLDGLVGVAFDRKPCLVSSVRFQGHHVSVGAWPNAWFPNLPRSGTAQPPACRAQKFSARSTCHMRALTRGTAPRHRPCPN